MKKYGRTCHLPNSPGATSDDRIMAGLDGLEGAELVLTEKMDGENTTIHAGGCHARSPDSRDHPSRNWLKAFAAGISPQLEPGERIVGENLYARHAIAYDALPSFFMGFALIRGDVVQGWDDTLTRFASLGITPVPVLHRGPFHAGLFDQVAASLNPATQEGFVARITSAFPEAGMSRRMGKYVRAGHVQPDAVHWRRAPLIPNRMR